PPGRDVRDSVPNTGERLPLPPPWRHRRGASDPNAPPEHLGRTLLPRKAQPHGAPSVAASAPRLHCGPGKLDGDRDAGGPAERNREREGQRAAGRVSAARVFWICPWSLRGREGVLDHRSNTPTTFDEPAAKG